MKDRISRSSVGPPEPSGRLGSEHQSCRAIWWVAPAHVSAAAAPASI